MSEFKTIGEVSTQLGIPQHVLRFWETQFSQIKPVKRRGGRRFYSESDVETIEKIKNLLYNNGYTIDGARRAIKQNFIPNDLEEMRKKKAATTIDDRQHNIFEALEKPNYDEKQTLNKILDSLKQIKNLLDKAS